jgi:hypothetical protein
LTVVEDDEDDDDDEGMLLIHMNDLINFYRHQLNHREE